MPWRDISTAPTDGTIILLFCSKSVERPGYGDALDRASKLTLGYFGSAEHSGGNRWWSIETVTEYHDYGGMTGVSTWTENIPVSPEKWLDIPAVA